MLRVETDDGQTETSFRVFQLGSMAFRDAHLSQGLEEYPPVAGIRMAMIIRMSTPTSGFPSPQLESFWGYPAYDHTALTIRRNGSLVGTITEADTLGIALNSIAGEAEIPLLIEVPPAMVSDPGDYDFDLRMERTGPGPLLFMARCGLCPLRTRARRRSWPTAGSGNRCRAMRRSPPTKARGSSTEVGLSR